MDTLSVVPTRNFAVQWGSPDESERNALWVRLVSYTRESMAAWRRDFESQIRKDRDGGE